MKSLFKKKYSIEYIESRKKYYVKFGRNYLRQEDFIVDVPPSLINFAADFNSIESANNFIEYHKKEQIRIKIQ